MKKRLVRFGTVLFVDYMKRKYNKESWPYCAPVILDGNNEIGVVGESLNLSESLDGYFFVLNSIFEMVPEFDPSSTCHYESYVLESARTNDTPLDA